LHKGGTTRQGEGEIKGKNRKIFGRITQKKGLETGKGSESLTTEGLQLKRNFKQSLYKRKKTGNIEGKGSVKVMYPGKQKKGNRTPERKGGSVSRPLPG